ncbi:hypothetical protein [Lachnoclostridium phytofermentans]|uniref:Histidine kinase n=1 Tax=Lachnoclostridium phytofermentans (strain ATCC 700394 / DSM 18823 / ISDg) TaxID=357809 RepID=A9KLA9_LACP7|nr:hypothetical protein [Lachnoclostridium phytofermentans]ABX41238.1 hypothetical protein Cphy_0852 [Lachnoclostridium phytofermentans ISDg]
MALRRKKGLFYLFTQLSSNLTMPSDLRSIFISLEEGFFLFNSKDEIIEANSKGKKIYQYKDFKLYDIIFYLLHNQTHGEREEILTNIKKRKDEVTFECLLEGRAYLVTIFFVNNIKDLLLYTNVIIHETTNEKQLELQKQNDTLFQSIELYKKQLQIINTLEEERARLQLLQTIQNSILVRVEDVMNQVHELREDENFDEKTWQLQLNNLAEEIRKIILEVRTSVVNLKV